MFETMTSVITGCNLMMVMFCSCRANSYYDQRNGTRCLVWAAMAVLNGIAVCL